MGDIWPEDFEEKMDAHYQKKAAGIPVLWCMHQRGPDDVIPATSYEDAVKRCDEINEFLIKAREKLPAEHRDIVYWAMPAIWPWSAEKHAESLAKEANP